MKRLLRAVIPLVAVATAATTTSSAANACAPGSHGGWFGTWGASVAQAGTSGTSAEGFTDVTLRQVARISLGGQAVELRFSNRYGTRPLVIRDVTVADQAGSSGPGIVPGTVRPVRFGGQRSVTIPVGQDRVSDPVRFDAGAGTNLVVSTYLPGPTGPVTWHWLGLSTNFTSTGDRTADPGSAFTPMDSARYYLDGVAVRTIARGAIAFFGDSITDGNGSPVDADLRYSDQVATRLRARPARDQCGVLNQSISGNRLLLGGLIPQAGASGVSRFTQDISRPGVKSVIVLEGINDILTGGDAATYDDLIAGYRSLIRQGHARGVEVFGGTLTPFGDYVGYTAAGEALRQQVNRWIRTSGAFDGVVDFDAAVRDPADPTRLLPAYESPDGIHPNALGYGAMAAAVDLNAVC